MSKLWKPNPVSFYCNIIVSYKVHNSTYISFLCSCWGLSVVHAYNKLNSYVHIRTKATLRYLYHLLIIMTGENSSAAYTMNNDQSTFTKDWLQGSKNTCFKVVYNSRY